MCSFQRDGLSQWYLCTLYSAVGQFMIPENKIQNGNASRSFLLACKAAELADSLIITDLGEVMLAGAGEK